MTLANCPGCWNVVCTCPDGTSYVNLSVKDKRTIYSALATQLGVKTELEIRIEALDEAAKLVCKGCREGNHGTKDSGKPMLPCRAYDIRVRIAELRKQ